MHAPRSICSVDRYGRGDYRSPVMLARLVVLALVLVSVPASASLTVELAEGGGNAAGYGQVLILNGDTVIGACPPNAYQGTNCHGYDAGFGQRTCVIDEYDDVPAGTVLTARVEKEFAYAARCGCGIDCPLYPPCSVEFQGFGGLCNGFGTPFEWAGDDAFDCDFTYGGSGTLTTTWAFSGSVSSEANACVDVPDTTPTTVPGATTTTTTLGGPTSTTLPDPFFGAMDDLAEQLLGKAVLSGLGRLGADFVSTANGLPPGRVSATATTAATGSAQGVSAGDVGVVVARGKAKVKKSGAVTLRLKLTRKGKKLRKTAPSLTLAIEVTGTAKDGRTANATRVVALVR